MLDAELSGRFACHLVSHMFEDFWGSDVRRAALAGRVAAVSEAVSVAAQSVSQSMVPRAAPL
eukprot:9498123-Pyramimonas_sp.AAC.1